MHRHFSTFSAFAYKLSEIFVTLNFTLMKKLIPGNASPSLLILLCLMAACKKKEPDPVIEGSVLEYGTEIPIKNAAVSLRSYDGEFLGPISSSIVDTEVSDENGYFSMPYPERTVLRVNAAQTDYFSDDFSEVGVSASYKEDIHLHPYAWIRVKIRNESGAYGFYPDREESWKPVIQLSQGEELVITDKKDLRKGNENTKYLFSPKLEEGSGPPRASYWPKAKAYVDGQEVPIHVGIGAYIDFYLPGHDTTDIFIVY